MKIFNRGSFVLSVTITISLTLVLLIYSYYESIHLFKLSEWIETIILTLLATSSAFLFGLYIYLRQVKDERNRTRAFLKKYLNFIVDELAFIPDSKLATIKHLNPDIVDSIILSGHVEEIELILIKVQSQIRVYQQFREEAISYLNNPMNNSKGLPINMKSNIDNSGNTIRKSVTICLKEISEKT